VVGGKATALISSGQVRLETLPYLFFCVLLLNGRMRLPLALRNSNSLQNLDSHYGVRFLWAENLVQGKMFRA
jgi:hypothetical protein